MQYLVIISGNVRVHFFLLTLDPDHLCLGNVLDMPCSDLNHTLTADMVRGTLLLDTRCRGNCYPHAYAVCIPSVRKGVGIC